MSNNHKLNIKYCLNNFPLRFSITDFCNIRCFFCSNEGMALDQKNIHHVDLRYFKIIIKLLAGAGLKKLSVTGGDPTLHPEINKIISFLNRFDFEELYFHTNGINLDNKLVNKLSKKFTKISISIHSVNFKTWRRITGGGRKQFDSLINNIETIFDKYKNKFILELKYVPIKGVNDSAREIKSFLDFCKDRKFKFKFLNFEPIKKEQMSIRVPVMEIVKKITNSGCKRIDEARSFRGQKAYLPIIPFRYNECSGAVIEIGCGIHSVCKKCYKSNEIFITPSLELKPCHIDKLTIPLVEHVKTMDIKGIAESILISRDFLFTSPGKNNKYWLGKI